MSGSYHLSAPSPQCFLSLYGGGWVVNASAMAGYPPWLVVLCNFGQLYIWSGAKGAQGVWMCIPTVVSGSRGLEQAMIGPRRCCSGVHLADSWNYFREHSCIHEIKGIGFLRTLTTMKRLTRTDAWPCLENFTCEYNEEM